MLDKKIIDDPSGKRRQNITTLFENLQKIGAGGEATPLVLQQLDYFTNNDWNNLIKDLKNIGQTTLSNNLFIVAKQRNEVMNLVDTANEYLKSPATIEDMLGIRSDLQQTGIYGNVQKARNLEIKGFSDQKFIIDNSGAQIQNPMYNEELDALNGRISNDLFAISERLRGSGKSEDLELLKDLENWMDMEEATFKLNQRSLKWRDE